MRYTGVKITRALPATDSSGGDRHWCHPCGLAGTECIARYHDAGVCVRQRGHQSDPYRCSPWNVAEEPTPTRTPTPLNIGNFVWDDLDADGNQDAGEPGLSDVQVQLWDSAKTSLIASTTTNSTGNYTLIAPAGPGDYRIRVLLPSAADQFSPRDATANDSTDSDINPDGVDQGFTDVYSFASNVISVSHIDAGIIRFLTPTPTRTPTPLNIGNFVWDDLDADGNQDAGEPGLSDVQVQLWDSAKTSLIASTTTNSTGNYTLIAPAGPGDYRIRVLLLPGAATSSRRGTPPRTTPPIATSTPTV